MRTSGLLLILTACGRVGFSSAPPPPDDAAVLADALLDAAGDAPREEDVGCADGEREAFRDAAAFPAIAGCAASWAGDLSLRAAGSGTACGNSIGPCTAPRDACAVGWSICGDEGREAAQLAAVLPDPLACRNEGSATDRFVAAVSHCAMYVEPVCSYDAPFGCFDDLGCAEPVCCGAGCTGLEICQSGVYPDATLVPTVDDFTKGCGGFPGDLVTGVLCCQD